jgi:pyruvate/2-oxoglutarate dehydrogenase complex dihydrolipoamide dehydrogenase (E3) component
VSRVERFDVFVIGGGGTGSEVAYQLGERSDLRVALAEREFLGGECNHYGCVPTKVMLRSAKVAHLARRSQGLGLHIPSVEIDLRAIQQRARDIVDSQSGEGAAPFERIGVTVFLQEARIVGEHRIELADGTEIEADRIVLATGTEATIPPVPGLAEGRPWTNREAIWEPATTPGRLAVIGAGAIGVEFAQIYARFGAGVTMIESASSLLPREDPDVGAVLAPALEAEGVELRIGARLSEARHDGATWQLAFADGETLETDEVLVASGRRPVFEGHELAAAGVELDELGRPALGPTLRTSAEGVWVAGDATGELLFTHVGSYEAELVVDDILGRPRERDYTIVPRVTFSDPEVATVGLSEPQAREAGHDVVTATSRIEDNERAVIDDAPFGIVKLVAEGPTGRLLGGHIVAEEAGSMIHEVVAVMAGDIAPPAIGDAIHAYPTLSESVKGAFQQLAERLER